MLYCVFFIVIIFTLISGNEKTGSYKLLFVLSVLFLMTVSAFRDAFLYPDISNYYDYFRDQYEKPDENFGVGYKILNIISRRFFPNFQFLLVVISIFVIESYARVIKRYSPYIFFSLLLYILINYYPSFFLLRQYLAIAVFLISIKYIIRREPIKFGICALIAFSFHATAILIIPLYFFYGMKNSKVNLMFLAVGAVMFIVVFYSLQEYVNIYSAYYAYYFEKEVEDSAWQRALLKVYIAVVYLYVMRKRYYDDGINRIVFYGMIFNVIICIAAMNIYSAHRLREYYAYADFIGIPIIIRQANMMMGGKKLLVLLLVSVYIGALAISFNNFILGGNMNNNYQLFWNGTI